MSAIVNLALADGQATPVTKTFEVGSAQMGTSSPAIWYEKTGGTFSTFKSATLLVRRSNAGKATKVSVRVTDPSVTASGEAYNTLAVLEFTLPDSANLQNRKDILAYAKNILGTVTLQSAVHDMSPSY